jgi:hypothetical protein
LGGELIVAISKTLQLLNKLTVPHAYIRVDTVAGYKGKITASANVYLSEAAFFGQPPFTTPGGAPDPQGYLEQIIFDFTPDVSETGKNFIEQAYAALKRQARFSDAADC